MPRVLIVDDSPTSRQMLANILSGDPELEVVGFAENGAQAIQAVNKLRPDVITMDLNMPVMDGFEATREIMFDLPTPIVVVSGTSRAKEVETAMEALRVGALNLLLKPVSTSSPDFDARAKEIVNTVKAMAGVYMIRRRRRLASGTPSPAVTPTNVDSHVQSKSVGLIAIAASTGGPPALAKVLEPLPHDFPLPIVVVQHIVDGFIGGFAQWLDTVVAPRIKLATDQEVLEPGTVYVAPPGYHLGVTPSRIRLSDADPIGGFRPAATYMFNAVADGHGSDAIGVILTGMGDDGVDGLVKLHNCGATTIAQNEETCAVYGMPKAAIEANCIDFVLPVEAIGGHLCELAHKLS